MAVADILLSAARILYSDVGTALPDETTVAYGGAWSSWTELALTSAPLRVTYRDTFVKASVQQFLTPVKAFRTSEMVNASSAMAEVTGDNLEMLLSGTNTDTSAGASQKAYSRIIFGGNVPITPLQWGFEGWRIDTAGTKQPVRFFIYSALITFDGQLTFGQSEIMNLPFRLESFADTGKSVGGQLGEMHIVTAPATS